MEKIQNNTTRIGNFPRSQTMLKTINDDFIAISNIGMRTRRRTDKFSRKILQKWEGVPRLLPRIVEAKVINAILGN